MVGVELGGDLRHEPLEARVPAVLARVQHPVTLDQPAEVAGLGAADRHRVPLGLERALELLHRGDRGGRVRSLVEQRPDLLAGGLVQRRVRVLAVAGQLDELFAAVGGEGQAVDQAVGLEPLQQAAQLTAVHRGPALERRHRMTPAPSS